MYILKGEYQNETFYVDSDGGVYNYYGDPEFGLSRGMLSNLREC